MYRLLFICTLLAIFVLFILKTDCYNTSELKQVCIGILYQNSLYNPWIYSSCAWASKLVVLYTSCVNFYMLVSSLQCVMFLKELDTHKYAMYSIQFKSCQSFYRTVKTLAVYMIINDKRISSRWPRIYHSTFLDTLVLHSDFTLPYNCDIVHVYTIYHFSLHHGNNEAVLLSGSHSSPLSVWYPLNPHVLWFKC